MARCEKAVLRRGIQVHDTVNYLVFFSSVTSAAAATSGLLPSIFRRCLTMYMYMCGNPEECKTEFIASSMNHKLKSTATSWSRTVSLSLINNLENGLVLWGMAIH